MSGSEIIALAAVIVSGVVGIATLGFNFWTQSRQRAHALERLKLEHEERYRSDLYAKRLEAHQRAFFFVMQLAPMLASVRSTVTERASQGKVEILALCERADLWWDENCLYLDFKSRTLFQELLIESGAVAHNATHRPLGRPPEDVYLDVWLAIQEGIGMKHLDKQLGEEALRA